MQPPLKNTPKTVADWFDRIKQDADRALRQHAAAQADEQTKRAIMRAQIEARRPMREQVLSWWNSLPPDIQARQRWQLAEITPHMRGRYKATPHRGVVTQALRELGWTEHRDWTVRGRGLRYWSPPTAA
ncbi:hypothetical protein [Ralstonia insidiosa]|uniref:hypothetical protein n=1 Tax=Ralstonia insidiosa TaxID=190721 RepID=UPI001427BE2E|nr:hypothetical protein [Ralstonia insidiosa]